MRTLYCKRLIKPTHQHQFGVKSNNIPQRRRNISILNQAFIGTPQNTQVQNDLDRAIKLVQKYDPAGYLPGLLVNNQARMGYFAVRGFWIDSGLRFIEEPFSNSISSSKQIAGIGEKGIKIPDDERLEKWKEGIDSLYEGNDSSSWQNDATLRLLHHVMQEHTLSKKHFDRIILGREEEINKKHYATVENLKDHVEMSCGSLLFLILECANIYQYENNNLVTNNDIIYEAAKHIGVTHGLSNALRLSVPKASSTGKVIIPQDLCDKYGINSPRYLLSALGMGDEECKSHLRSAVSDIVDIARNHLNEARLLRHEITSHPRGDTALSTFLPSLASETFLNRLEQHTFDLTDRQLRNVGMKEHISCATRMVAASYQKTF